MKKLKLNTKANSPHEFFGLTEEEAKDVIRRSSEFIGDDPQVIESNFDFYARSLEGAQNKREVAFLLFHAGTKHERTTKTFEVINGLRGLRDAINAK